MKKREDLRTDIQEAIEQLPGGICFFDRNGLPVLCNSVMARIASSLTGQDLWTLSALQDALQKLPEDSSAGQDGEVFLSADGSVWCFTVEIVIDEFGMPYTQVLASEVSALYPESHEPAECRAEQALLQAELHAIAQIRDSLNSSLSKSMQYYGAPDCHLKAEVLAEWRKALSVMEHPEEDALLF